MIGEAWCGCELVPPLRRLLRVRCGTRRYGGFRLVDGCGSLNGCLGRGRRNLDGSAEQRRGMRAPLQHERIDHDGDQDDDQQGAGDAIGIGCGTIGKTQTSNQKAAGTFRGTTSGTARTGLAENKVIVATG
jgi:hypothetical protein